MPYLILTAHGEELDRRELKGPLTLGRSPSCDLNVHDILMSRVHCRIEPCDGGRWKLLDLASKNGTHLRWSRITEHTLVEGDWFRVSRTKMSFYAGAFIPPVAGTVRKSKLVRPADPHEALNGTVSDFVYVEAETAGEEFDAHPSPVRPAAPLPIPVASTAALAGATTAAGSASVLEEISSSWDSIVATASRPNRLARPLPRPRFDPLPGKFLVNRHRPADLSLQVLPRHIPFMEIVPPLPHRTKASLGLAIALTLGVGIATALVLLSGWALSG